MRRLVPSFSRLLRHNCFVVFLLALVLSSQLSSAQPAPEKTVPPQTIVTSADEVSLDLVVRDKKGRPVLDLRPEDIAVTDSGSEVKISTLRLVTSESDSDHLVAFVFDPLDSVAASNSRDIAAKILKIVPEKGFSFAVLKAEGRLKLYQNYTTNRS